MLRGFAATTILAVGLLTTTQAFAQASRLFLSGSGSDSGTCSRAAPCRTLQYAHNIAAAGSELAILDTAGYGAITITKSISVINPGGVEAGISVASGADAITINAGANDTVNLRGLTIDGLGVANNGVTFHSAANVSITNCVIRHFVASGIYSGTTVASNLFIADSLISDNGTYSGSYGLYLLGQSANPATVTVERVSLVGNYSGVGVSRGSGPQYSVNLTLVDSNVSRSTQYGLYAQGGGQITARNSTINYNPTAIFSDASSLVLLARDTIVFNQTVTNTPSQSTVFSFGDNYIRLNATEASLITTPTE